MGQTFGQRPARMRDLIVVNELIGSVGLRNLGLMFVGVSLVL